MSAPLSEVLQRLDRQPYANYRDLRGQGYPVGPFTFRFTRIQGDPFAPPSHIRVDAAATRPALPPEATHSADARRATADYLHRALLAILTRSEEEEGGKARLTMAGVGQEVLDRTAVRVAADGSVIVRVRVGLPAHHRRIQGKEAARLVTDELAWALKRSLKVDLDALLAHVRAVEDQVALRAALAERGLVAFLAEGAVLARASGVDDGPLADAVALAVPDTLAVELVAPHAGPLRGLGVPEGVTLIVGGGYHGKSTLLAALARGVYDHVPGDGRDRCVTRADAMSVRAEDGRFIGGVDLRPFISHLPGGRDTSAFESADASGSTSQAAAIVEALEAGAKALFVDEDTAATNFMIRDARMRRLVPTAAEPITPFIDRVRQLAEGGVSSVLVVGGAGDYLDVADTVIRMQAYVPDDATAEAREVAALLPLGESPRAPGPWPAPAPRVPDPAGLDPSKGRKTERVRAIRTRYLEFGESEVDLSAVAQLVDPGQTRLIGDALLYLARGLCDGRRTVVELLALLEATWADDIGIVAAYEAVDRARPRPLEVAAAINRLRSLKLK
ncbi:MAG: ABC-ATPase domain-containing protein [Myxococcales bacterium]|nr:ABC-ATPase domain-containing protein [Myxococcales bacterium]